MRRRFGLVGLMALCVGAVCLLWRGAPPAGPAPAAALGRGDRGQPPGSAPPVNAAAPVNSAATTAGVSETATPPPPLPISYREALLRDATVLVPAQARRDARGRAQRVSLVQAAYKYPLLRVERTVARDSTTSAPTELPPRVMVADHILVTLQPGASIDDLHFLNDVSGGVIRRALRAAGTYLVAFPHPGVDLVPEQVRAYADATSVIAFAEPDYIVFATATFPGDPRFPELHGLHNSGQSGGAPDADVDAPEAWDLTTGDGTVVVGVIDSGIDYRHEDLAANVWINSGEIAGNGLDDDGNGFIDDVHGWDFANHDPDPFDDGDHGTHVSGTLAGVGDNGIGVAGMSWHTKIMGLKFLNGSGFGATSDAIDAVRYATLMRQRGINIRLTNNSWGGGGYSQALLDAIIAGAQADILFVVAAGNDGLDNDLYPHYPSSYDHDCVVSVANTTDLDQLSLLSNFGAESVDLSAPGSDILSTTPYDTYSVFSGTSMAAPLVSGVGTLFLSLAPDATYAEVREAILTSVDPVPGLAGRVATDGRLNALRTLEQLGMLVRSSLPAGGSVTSIPPTRFEISFSEAHDPSTLQPDDLAVDGIAAAQAQSLSSNSVLFRFVESPAVVEGLHTMVLAEDSVSRLKDGDGVAPWSRTFRYDALPLEVIASTPGTGTPISLPLTTLRLQFNEPPDPASVGMEDLILSTGQVVRAFQDEEDTVDYVLTGIEQEGTLTVHVPAGALTDVHGNPCLPHTAAYALDFDIVTMGSWSPREPVGSLTYAAASPGAITSSSDMDRFAVELEPDQFLTVVAEAEVPLRPVVVVRGPSGQAQAVATATGPGESALIQGVTVATAGTYTIELAGSGGSMGEYVLSVDLNAVRELEPFSGDTNDSAGTAQALDPVFMSAGFATRASVIGDAGIIDGLVPIITTETEPNDDGVAGGATTDLEWANEWSGSFIFVDTDRFGAVITGNIARGSDNDWDFFRILAAPGDTLEVFLRGLPSGAGTLDDPYLRLYDRDGTEIASNDDFDGLESFLRFSQFAYAGEYYVVADSFGTSTGSYTLDAVMISTSLTPGRGAGEDWYEFSMQAGQSLSLVVVGLTGIAPDLELYRADGSILAAIAADTSDMGRALLDFPAAAAEVHYVRITGARPYHLVATRDAVFSVGGNTDQPSAQPLTHTRRALGAVGAPDAWFSLPVEQGARLTISTQTPGDAPGLFDNALDPGLELYSPAGVLLAQDDNSAPDGRNASLSHASLSAGHHGIRLLAARDTAGEFVLNVRGSTVGTPPFQVAVTDPGEGVLLDAAPDHLVVDFTQLLRPDSVDAGDLLVDGAPAASVILDDGDSLRFVFPPLNHGPHTLSIPAGALADIAGVPNDAFSMDLDVDLIPPRVVASSIQDGDILSVGDLRFSVTFSEPILGELLDAHDLTLAGDSLPPRVASEVSYDPTNLTLTALFPALPDDRFTLTLLSRPDAFRDPAGHLLDGETLSWPIPPQSSGDGTDGGDFVVTFHVDVEVNSPPTAFHVCPPAGAMVHASTWTTLLAPSGDVDRFILDLEAGQMLSAVASPVSDTQPSLTLYDPANRVVGAVAAGGRGLPARLQALPLTTAGTYALEVTGVGDVTGPVDLTVRLNAALEEETERGSSNEGPGSAEDLDGWMLPVSTGGVARAAVAGSPAGAPASPLLVAEIEPNDDGIAGGSAADLPFAEDWSGSFARTGPDRSTATLTGQISFGDDVDLDFFRLEAGPGDVLEINLYGEPSGRGTLPDPYLRLFNEEGEEIAFDDDGGEGVEASIHYSEFAYRGRYYVVADSFGSSVGGYILEAEHISPQQVNAESPGEDWYRFTLAAGDDVSLVLGASGPGPLALELHRAARVGIGAPAANAAASIQGVVAATAGEYYARVMGTAPYTLALIRGAAFEHESADPPASAQAAPDSTAMLGHLTGSEAGDRLRLDALPGNVLTLTTRTPGDAPGAFENLLDPVLELYDPGGILVASDDNSNTDGRNAVLTHTAASSGGYELNILSAAGSGGPGEYLLEWSGATGPRPDLQVMESFPNRGQTVSSRPTDVIITFSAMIDLTSLQASDLLVNGVPSPSIAVIDGRTIAFALPPLSTGIYPVWMPSGAVTSLAGTPLEPTFFLFFAEGPRVIASAVQDGDVLAPGPIELALTFDRPMADAGLDPSDLAVVGAGYGEIVPIFVAYSIIAPTGSVLRVGLPELRADTYTLTLFSGDTQFEDQAGNHLDGEIRGRPIPPQGSGNGIAGGDFVLSFVVARPDADGDGLSDAWELRHNLDPNDDGSIDPDNGSAGDPDGDGADNGHEQAAGTNPRDGGSRFVISEIVPGMSGVSIRVSTQPGRHYTVEFRAGPAWTPFADPRDGIGTWMETNINPSTHTFLDDFSPDTTGGFSVFRSYRVHTNTE